MIATEQDDIIEAISRFRSPHPVTRPTEGAER